MSTGERIKNARTKAGLTQVQLAEKIGTTAQNISQYERNIRNPKIETVFRIAKALGCNIADLDPELAIMSPELLMFHDNIANYDEEKNEILTSFLMLNAEGRAKAVERMQELTEIPKYQIYKRNKDNDNNGTT